MYVVVDRMTEVECTLCPVHGRLTTRGMTFKGTVASARAPKTAVIEVQYVRRVPKYERYEKLHSKIHAHVPECMNVEEGDVVEVAECRKVSKTKAHVVIKMVSKASGPMEEQAVHAAKRKKASKKERAQGASPQ